MVGTSTGATVSVVTVVEISGDVAISVVTVEFGADVDVSEMVIDLNAEGNEEPYE